MPKPAANVLMEPVPHEEAARWTEDKPLVSRQVFAELLPELRARAFLVAGIEDANTLGEVRSILASVPRGMDWVEAKKAIMAKVGPWLEGDEQDGNKRAIEARAELLLRTHGFQAYQVAGHKVMRAQEGVFPYWQYLSLEDEKVRPGHAALNLKVFPANSPFWHDHSPPWQWGCRCRKVALLPEEVDALKQAEAGLPPERQSVMEGPALDLAEQGRMYNAAGQQIDIKSDRQKGKAGFLFDPDALTLPLYQLRDRYDATTWAEFESQAKLLKLDDGRTVWGWLNGIKAGPPAGGGVVPLPHAPAVSTDVDGALAIAGIADRTQPINAAQASALLAELKESAPVSASSKIVSVAAKPSGVLTESFILQQAQDFMDFLPPSVVNSLPPLHIQVCDWLNAYGEYNKGLVKLGGVSLKTKVKARETIFHELAHWVHLELPGMHPWVQAIKAHFEARTAGEAVVTLGNYAVTGLRDQWWEVYMGRVYNLPEEATHLGVEFPTRNFELLAAPNRFAAVWSKSPEAREDIYLALKGLYP